MKVIITQMQGHKSIMGDLVIIITSQHVPFLSTLSLYEFLLIRMY